MRNADIHLYFTLYSRNLKSKYSYGEVISLLTPPTYFYVIGEDIVLTNGRISPRPAPKTCITYKLHFSTYYVEECSDYFLNLWKDYDEQLSKIFTEMDYYAELNFSIDFYNGDAPSMMFNPEFLTFLSKHNITLSFNIGNINEE